MLKSDFANYTGLYGRGIYLAREHWDLVTYAEQHPQTAAQLLVLFNSDSAKIVAALTAAQQRAQMSGPGGGPWVPGATSIDTTPATGSIAVGATQQLVTARVPSNAGGTVTYTTSDATKATVSSTGLVTGVAAGTATITAHLGARTDTSVITVTA